MRDAALSVPTLWLSLWGQTVCGIKCIIDPCVQSRKQLKVCWGWDKVATSPALLPSHNHQLPELLHLGAYRKQGRTGGPKAQSSPPCPATTFSPCPPAPCSTINTPLLVCLALASHVAVVGTGPRGGERHFAQAVGPNSHSLPPLLCQKQKPNMLDSMVYLAPIGL